jgi:putative inorganic carbon (HCO3(-)) transporter
VQRTLLILLVPASYLLLAGGRPWTLVPLLTIAAAAAFIRPTRTFAFVPPTRALDVALLAIALALGVQLMPLPAAAVAALSPHASEVRSAIIFSPLSGAPPSWMTLSVNPAATATALATFVLGVLSFWVARAVFSAGGGTRLFCRALTFLATLAAAMAVIQRAVAPRTVLFLLEPEARSANPFGAFVNRNHFAAWLLLAAAPVCGYCIARMRTHQPYGQLPRSIGQIMSSSVLFTAIGLFGQIGVLIMTLSRSAVAGLGVAAITGWRLGRPRMQIERTSLPGVLGAIGAALLLVVLFVDLDGWATRLEHSVTAASGPASRTTIWRESIPVVKDFWLTGTGAGTYGDAMTVYQQSRIWVGAMHRWAHFNNAHSHYVQVAAEGGLLLVLPVLAALALLSVLGLRAVRADKGEMFWVRVGAAAGLAGLAAQSVWEIALVMPANAVLAGIGAGLLLHRRDAPKTGAPALTPELMTPRPRPARAG